jgi:aminotransferase
MTGWRLGYMAAPRDIMQPMVKVHQYNVTCAPSISQIAGIEALKNGESSLKEMVAEYDKRRLYCYERIKSIGLRCFEPTGAFYIFPDICRYGLSSEDFCKKLLYDSKLAVVPGSAFGSFGEGYIRISYAYSMEMLTEGFNRLEEFISKLCI